MKDRDGHLKKDTQTSLIPLCPNTQQCRSILRISLSAQIQT